MKMVEQTSRPVSRAERASYLRQVAFTGRLATMTRRAAGDFIVTAGGHVSEHVSRRTSALVVGIGGFPLTREGGVTKKFLDAERLGIPIISEQRFRELLGLAESTDGQKSYPRSTVAELLGIERRTLDRWEAMGLINSINDRFDFQDIVSLRTIGELLSRGVKPVDIALSIRQLSRVLPGTQRPLSQLRIVDQFGELVAELGDVFVASDGQFVINFERSHDEPPGPDRLRLDDVRSACDWLEIGWAHEDEGDLHAARNAYARATLSDPALVEAHFNLGNVLRDLGEPDDAIKAFQQAIRIDSSCAPAWYNLADLHMASGETAHAIEALRQAVIAAPDFADAHFNLADALDAAGEGDAAATHWRTYLQLDPSSEWALEARRRLSGR